MLELLVVDLWLWWYPLLLVIVFVVIGLYSCEQNYQVLVHMFLVLVQWLMNFPKWIVFRHVYFVDYPYVVFCCCCFMNWLCFPVGWLVDLHLWQYFTDLQFHLLWPTPLQLSQIVFVSANVKYIPFINTLSLWNFFALETNNKKRPCRFTGIDLFHLNYIMFDFLPLFQRVRNPI